MKRRLRNEIVVGVFFLAVVLIGYNASNQEHTYSSKEAIAKVETLGGSVEIDKTNPESPVVTVSFKKSKVSDTDISFWKYLDGLETFKKSKIGDTDIKFLKYIDGLETLDLKGTIVSGQGLIHLKGMTSLKRLRMRNGWVTDAGLKQIKELTSLIELDVAHSHVTDTGLAYIGELQGLQELSLCDTLITNEGLAHLKGLGELRYLEMESIPYISDAGLEHLKVLPKLTQVVAQGTKCTKAGIAQLEKVLSQNRKNR